MNITIKHFKKNNKKLILVCVCVCFFNLFCDDSFLHTCRLHSKSVIDAYWLLLAQKNGA